MTSTIEFNQKKFDYQKLLQATGTAVNAMFKPTELCIKATAENVVFKSCDNDGAEVIIYFFKGTYLILSGMPAVRRAIAENKEIKAKLFTKHTLAKCDLSAPAPVDFYDDSVSQRRPYGSYERSGRSSDRYGDRNSSRYQERNQEAPRRFSSYEHDSPLPFNNTRRSYR